MTIIPTAAGIFGVVWGTHTYRESQVLKRKEIIFPLIDMFDRSEKMEIAKRILDDFPDIQRRFFDNGKIDKEKFKIDHPEDYYHKTHLKEILKIHKEKDDEGHYNYAKEREILRKFDDAERVIRDSFDNLLAFFKKLEYLRKINLIRQEDLSYFRYYIDRAAEDPAVLEYVKNYDFQLGEGLIDERFRRR
jgi:hypothetical protein